jgi:hypothetical protein
MSPNDTYIRLINEDLARQIAPTKLVKEQSQFTKITFCWDISLCGSVEGIQTFWNNLTRLQSSVLKKQAAGSEILVLPSTKLHRVTRSEDRILANHRHVNLKSIFFVYYVPCILL